MFMGTQSFFFLIGNVAYDKTALVIILSQLVYKGKSQLKEHWKILNCLRFHFMKASKKSQKEPSNKA